MALLATPVLETVRMGVADHPAAEGGSLRTSPRTVRTDGVDNSSAVTAALQRACSAFPRRGDPRRFQDDGEGPLPYYVPGPVLAAIRSAVVAFVSTDRRKRLPPERVLVELMEAINTDPLKHDYGRDQTALRETVFAAFISAYYIDRAD